jgi:alginate O-acetyltransferase complex protein AlgI
VRRFVLGLGKKLLLANTLGQAADGVFALPPAELNAPLAWLGLACYTLQIYFDFSGYSDMAIGLMRMLGFRILENFNHRYIARSIREFWRRWHISLFVLWGAWHGLFLVVERAGLERPLARHAAIAHAYTLAAVMGGWVLFRCDTLTHALGYYVALAGASGADPTLHPVGQYANGLVITTLVIGVILSTPIAWRLRAWRDRAGQWRGAGSLAVGAGGAWVTLVFIASAAMLAARTYNPFIYFRF